jgi:hypothetical protein
MKRLQFATCVALTIMLSCCGGGGPVGEAATTRSLKDVTAGLDALLAKRILFGHQSVGLNIIDGLADVLRDDGGRSFTFVEARDPRAAAGPAFLHATIGSNGDPIGKIRDFDAIMRGGMGGKVDIAFMKLCYVDIGADTDAQEVFRAYRDTMAGLEASFPTTTFVHLTVPLVTREKGTKAFVKRLMGRKLDGSAGNRIREELNTLLRSEYVGKKPFFDLARSESTRTDGSRVVFTSGGIAYYALDEAYTDDGGHLNVPGRRFVAERLLVTLAELAP